jgi:translocation and assembly module TamA
LDPTSGYSIHLKSVPSLQLKPPHFAYCPTTFISTFYLPFQEDHRFVVAGKLTVGSIFGTSRHTIPPSERFYAGNENTLRGYGYETVSPLKDHKPIGGRSIMVLSLEARMRLSETLGLVGFYEIGNVYSSPAPQFNHEQLQSAGVGVRYHTAVGPIRLDFAFPLNRRPKVDGPFQAYLSIGQSF